MLKTTGLKNATVVNDKIYVTGGFFNSHDSVEDSDSFDCYDPTTDSWVSMGTLPFKLFDHGSVSLVYLSDKYLPTWMYYLRDNVA